MHPCDTAWPRSSGRSVPWIPTIPSSGQSVRRDEGARLERERAVERIRGHERRLDVESPPRWRLGTRRAHCHHAAQEQLPVPDAPHLDSARSEAGRRSCSTTGRASTASALTQPRPPFGRPGTLSRYHHAPSRPRRAESASTIWNCRSGRKRRKVRTVGAVGAGRARTATVRVSSPAAGNLAGSCVSARTGPAERSTEATVTVPRSAYRGPDLTCASC